MFLSDEFIDQYKTKEVPFGELGYITYKRTYARDLPELGRKEEWYETCRRVIEGNVKLEYDHLKKFKPSLVQDEELESLCDEAEQMYDYMFHLRWLPGGRGIWTSGTETASKEGSALTNCYYIDVKPREGKVSYPFIFTMDMLMLGCGVGFGVTNELIDLIPTIKNPVELFVVCSEDHKDYQILETDNKNGEWWSKTHQKIKVADSREGWIYAFKKVIDSSFLSKKGNPKTLVIDISGVRPMGDPIKGFGGKASGPKPLVELLRMTNKILNDCYKGSKKLSSIDCTDIMTSIGRCVVAGNVRRSALIALGDAENSDFIQMKNPVPTNKKLSELNSVFKKMTLDEINEHNNRIFRNRWASNNSLVIKNPDNFNAEELCQSIWLKGEPGFLNLDLVRNYGRLEDGRIEGIDGLANGTNPCGEISLEDSEPCNLSEIFPVNCNNDIQIYKAARFAYKYAKRVTLSKYNWDSTKEVVERNRRIGVSISGLQDWLLKLNNIELFLDNLSSLYEEIANYDRSFSQFLEVNESKKLTTVKPSGTISLLAGVSPGIHYPYAKYYIRRIQFQNNDPLVEMLKECGFKITDAVQTPNAVVCHFPIKARFADYEGFKTAGEVSAREQLEFQYLIQKYWADNQVSCTVSFQEKDKEELQSLIEEYSRKLKSTSFLPYTEDLKGHYPDLPYEPISLEEYEEMISHVKRWPSNLGNDLNFEASIEECAGGHCPIK